MSFLAVAGGLLGAVIGKPKAKYVVPPYDKIRAAAEKAGLNPLTALGMAPGSVVMSENPMGSAIAQSAMVLADKVDARQQLLSTAQSENLNLRRQVNSLTLRPNVGGIYANRLTAPSVRQALGVPNASVSSGVGVGQSAGSRAVSDYGLGRSLVGSSFIDPRREVDNAKIKSTSGVMVVDNPNVPFNLYAPTLDGDEALQWYEYPSLIAPAIAGSLEYAHKAGVDFSRGRWAMQRETTRRQHNSDYLDWEASTLRKRNTAVRNRARNALSTQ